uniref:BHLH domain-containing protein n=1 Tax=Kalanchoe fedtschenkoi TaxID=63787 RepID=A0A7N0USI4_KALFE
MESFFYQGRPGEATSSWAWLPQKPSDFVPYSEQGAGCLNVDSGEGMRSKNVKKRVVEMLRKKWLEPTVLQKHKERSFRRMVNERLRRQSHREGYTGLHAILPIGTKCDKVSITEAAISEIIKTRRGLEGHQRRNRELNEKLAAAIAMRGKVVGTSKVRIRVGNPTSGIHSMLEVLHCLKGLGSDIRRMQSHFSVTEFSAELEIHSQIAEDEVEKAVQTTLIRVEEKLLRQQSSMP